MDINLAYGQGEDAARAGRGLDSCTLEGDFRRAWMQGFNDFRGSVITDRDERLKRATEKISEKNQRNRELKLEALSKLEEAVEAVDKYAKDCEYDDHRAAAMAAKERLINALRAL